MKLPKVKLYITGLLFLSLASCGKEDQLRKTDYMYGKWIWTSTSGEFTGETTEPENENIALTLVIRDSTYQQFVNDSLIFETTYQLETSAEPLLGTAEKNLIIFESGKKQAVVIEKDKLEFIDQLYDGYTYKYKRF